MKSRMWLPLMIPLLVGACGGDSDEPSGDAPESVIGIVTEVQSAGLNDVTSFTVKDGDEVYEILIDESVNYGFPLGHVEEHRKLAAPVKVDIEEKDGKLYAVTIEDAPAD